MIEEKNEFDVEVIKQENAIKIKDYENVYAQAEKICNSFEVKKIENDEENKLAKEFRAKCNKAKDQIKNLRISTIKEITGELETQAKSLETLFDKKNKEIGIEVNAYADSKKAEKTLVSTKTYCLKLTYNSEKLTQKIIDFCEKNNITVEEI